MRNRNCKTVHARLFVRPGKNMEVARFAAVPVRLHRRDLDRLISQRVEAVLVAQKQLQWCEDRSETDYHAQHRTAFLDVTACEKVAGADRQHHKSRREIRGIEHVRETVGETWVKNDRKPINRMRDAAA